MNESENQCLLLDNEMRERRRCGHGYIYDYDQCLRCHCCFIPESLSGDEYDTAILCYIPMTGEYLILLSSSFFY